MSSIVVSSVYIGDELHTSLRKKFITFYKKAYKGWTEEQLGFPPSELDAWLQKQFAENVGEWFLLLNRDEKHKSRRPFLTFTAGKEFIDIFQIVSDAHETIDLLCALAQLYPRRPFYGVIRRENKERIEFFLQHGCKIVENRFPSYSNVYYCGLEMPNDAVHALTKKINTNAN